MSSPRRKLGKGLNEMFGGNVEEVLQEIENSTPKSMQVKIPLSEIRPNPHQPRRLFDEEKLNELAISISQHGVFTPVILKKSSIQGYEIVAGERRVRASKIAGLQDIPAIIVEFTDEEMMEIALLENIQREDLNAIEEAQAYRTMMDTLGLTQETLAHRVGKSRAHIANTLRLLSLPDLLQQMVLDGELSMGHVRPLITLDKEDAVRIAKRAKEEKLSVREVENIVKGLELQKKRKEKPKPEKNPSYSYVEDLLRRKFRTKVKVEDQKITLKFTNDDDLNRILELLDVIEDV